MAAIWLRLLVIVVLLAGAAAHGSIAAPAIDTRTAVGTANPNGDGCDMSRHGKMKPADCASVCAVAAADLAGVVSMLDPMARPSWPAADRSAEGLEPSPAPIPPRA